MAHQCQTLFGTVLMHKIKCIKRECQTQKLQAMVLKIGGTMLTFFYLWMGFKGYGNNEDDNGKWKYNVD